MRKNVLLILAVVLTLFGSTGVAQAAPKAEPFTFGTSGDLKANAVYGPFNIRAAHSWQCLDITGGTGATGDGVLAQQWDCLGGGQTNQQWYFYDTGDGVSYYITARHSGRCLDVYGGTGATGDGVQVQQWGCLGYNQHNQRWRLYTQDNNATLLIVAQHSNKCLDVRGGTGAIGNGIPIQQWTCLGNNQTNQRWVLTTP